MFQSDSEIWSHDADALPIEGGIINDALCTEAEADRIIRVLKGDHAGVEQVNVDLVAKAALQRFSLRTVLKMALRWPVGKLPLASELDARCRAIESVGIARCSTGGQTE